MRSLIVVVAVSVALGAAALAVNTQPARAAEVAATYRCEGNDLIVTVTDGDEPFTINAVSALGTTIITYIGYGPGDFLFATAGNLSNKFTSVTVTETGAGGDDQVLQLATEPIYCGAQQVAATYQCQGNDLLVTVTRRR